MGDLSFLTATTISRITQFLLNFLGNYCYGIREMFATEEDSKTIIWNNKEIKVENKPAYYKHYVNAIVIFVQDLLFLKSEQY